MITISEQINEILAWLHENKDNLDPVQCSQKLVEISVLKASLDSELADLEIAYNAVIASLVNNEPNIAFNKIKIIALDTEEYKKLSKTKAVAGSVLEVARSIKRYQNAVSDSMKMTQYN